MQFYILHQLMQLTLKKATAVTGLALFSEPDTDARIQAFATFNEGTNKLRKII